MRPYLLPLSLLAMVVNGLVNVTVDDIDTTSIVYRGLWDLSTDHKSNLDFGGSHTYSSDLSATATLTFTGVSVYFLAPRWPYSVNTHVALDNGPGFTINLTDPFASTTSPGGSESAQWSVAWSATGLANVLHTLVVSIAPTGEGIVDGFMYTVDNDTSSSSSASNSISESATSSSAASSATSSAASLTTPRRNDTLTTALGISVGIAVLIAAAVAFYFFFYRRRMKDKSRPHSRRVLFDSWGGNLDSEHPGYAQNRQPEVVPFFAPTSVSHQPLYPAAPSISADAQPLLTQFGVSTPYRDEPRNTTSLVSTSWSETTGKDSQSGPSTLSSSSAAGSSRGPGTAAARAAASINEKPQPPRQHAMTPAPPAYSA
ncbi:hypothetical protein MIND_00624100 [Mycena indigotica]|uniref:Mid2 domain-containing protein n=1 Tax=Mycena indigotica TaxID=2126181 RepID=A0A8H6SQ40_9AGAR|nr:uncharacterized protein MIND_00624100 [Mycena indigotica]KAF7303935.1 hypothetical protein MIND_00624100 [Mycena indigotica]